MLAAVVTGHVVALALVSASHPGGSIPPREVRATRLIAVAAELLPPIVAVPPRVPTKLPMPLPMPQPQTPVQSADSALTSTATQTGDCMALDAIATAIVDDPAALAAVVSAPPETRSIADAIVIWNARWSDATITPDAPLEPVRASVQKALSAIDQACLDEMIAGPRLVPVPAGQGTMLLVFGSGVWTWRQLLSDFYPTQAGHPMAAVAKSSR